MLAFALTIGVNAQDGKSNDVRSGRSVRVVRVVPVYPAWGMGAGFGWGYQPFNTWNSWNAWNNPYSPFNNPFPQTRSQEPSKLDLEEQDIKNNFQFQINTVKNDKNLSRSERKQRVRELKFQRDDALIDARKTFYNNREKERNKEVK